MADSGYWAARETSAIGGAIRERVEKYYTYLRASGILARWIRSYEAYYRGAITGVIGQEGDAGEMLSISVNQYRSLLRNVLAMTTSQAPAWEAQARNTDRRSMAQTILAPGILDYALEAKNVGATMSSTAEISLLLGDGYTMLPWDASLGTDFQVNPETGAMEKSGDLCPRSFTPLDVAVDPTKDSGTDHTWRIMRSYRNRYDLAAQYAASRDAVMAAPSRFEDPNVEWTFSLKVRSYYQDTDDCAVLEFFHDKTPAMPDGRYVLCVGSTALFDSALPYRKAPIYRMSPAEQLKSFQGYTDAFDLLPLQQAHDALHSTIVSNQAAFGTQNVVVPKGADIGVEQLAGGLNVIEVDPKYVDLIRPLNLLSTPKEIFDYSAMTEKLMETIIGVNSVARGNPEANLKSGNALALVQAMAVVAQSAFQRSWIQHQKDVGTGVIHTYQDFAKAPQVAMITGKANRSYLRDFTGEDLDMIDRVTVNVGSPLMRTAAGRIQVADNLLQAGLVKTPEEYFMVLETGRLEPLTEGPASEMMRIKAENEMLSEGKSVRVLAVQNHPLDISEHLAVVSDPDLDPNDPVVMATLQHILDHVTAWRELDPALAVVLKIPPAPPPPMLVAPAGPPGPPMAPPPGPPSPVPPGGPIPPGLLAPPNTNGRMPGMPSLPNNPLTGAKPVIPGVS